MRVEACRATMRVEAHRSSRPSPPSVLRPRLGSEFIGSCCCRALIFARAYPFHPFIISCYLSRKSFNRIRVLNELFDQRFTSIYSRHLIDNNRKNPSNFVNLCVLLPLIAYEPLSFFFQLPCFSSDLDEIWYGGLIMGQKQHRISLKCLRPFFDIPARPTKIDHKWKFLTSVFYVQFGWNLVWGLKMD